MSTRVTQKSFKYYSLIFANAVLSISRWCFSFVSPHFNLIWLSTVPSSMNFWDNSRVYHLFSSNCFDSKRWLTFPLRSTPIWSFFSLFRNTEGILSPTASALFPDAVRWRRLFQEGVPENSPSFQRRCRIWPYTVYQCLHYPDSDFSLG